VPSIWAIGDVTNRLNLTPVALMARLQPAVMPRQPLPVFARVLLRASRWEQVHVNIF